MNSHLRLVAEKLKSIDFGDRFIRRFPPLYHSFREELASFDTADIDQRRELQSRLLQNTMRTASKLPAYAGTVSRNFDQAPLLSKETLKSKGLTEFAHTGILTMHAQTSGTSGMPLELARSFASIVFEQATIDHIVAQAGANFGNDRVVIFRGDIVKPADDKAPPYWSWQSGDRVLKCSAAHLNLNSADAFRDILSDFAPKILWAYPSVLELLVSTLETLGLTVKIPVILTSSEVLTKDVRERAERYFGGKVIDYYGQAERVSFACDSDGSGYRFLASYGQVELLRTGDATRYEIVSTNLRNSAMVLLRYRTGDIAVLESDASSNEIDEITLGIKPFKRIEGREGDYLIAPNGGRLIGMNHVPRGIPGILQMQIHQPSLTDIVVYAISDGEKEKDARLALEAALKPRLHNKMRLKIKFSEKLQRTTAGKLPLIIRNPELEQAD